MVKAGIPQWLVCAFFIYACIVAPLSVHASDREDTRIDPIDTGEPFRLDPLTDGILLGTGFLLNGTTLVMDKMASQPIVRDEKDLDIADENQFDGMCAFPYSQSLDTASTILSYTALLTPAVLLAAPDSEWLTIGTMYAESVMLTWGLKELGKNLIKRHRPYMYFDDYPQEEVANGDFLQSFPSGHTALAFCGASFSSFVFSQYFPDSPWKIPLISVSYTLAATTSALRIASGNHFLSDVVVGAAIGTFSGLFVPWMHMSDTKQKKQGSEGKKLSISVIPTGINIRVWI